MDRRRGGGGGRGGSGRGRGRGGFGGGGGRGGGFGGRGGGFGGRGGGRGRGRGGRGGGRGGGPDSRGSTRRREEAEVSELVARIEAEVPEAGTQETIGKDFTDLPICGYTIAGECLRLPRISESVKVLCGGCGCLTVRTCLSQRSRSTSSSE